MSKLQQILGILVILLFLSNCAGIRKAKAGDILKECKFSLENITLESVQIDPDLFPRSTQGVQSPFPNPQIMSLAQDLLKSVARKHLGNANLQATLVVRQVAGKDSLWIHSLKGTLALDTLIQADWNLQKPVVLKEGANEFPVSIQLPMDARLFRIMEPDSMILVGILQASLSKEGSQIPFEFKQKWRNPKEKVEIFLKNAKQEILDGLLNGWARSFHSPSSSSP